jgi:hypothetical protein
MTPARRHRAVVHEGRVDGGTEPTRVARGIWPIAAPGGAETKIIVNQAGALALKGGARASDVRPSRRRHCRCRIRRVPDSVGSETDWPLCTVLRCLVTPKTPDPDATITSAQEARKCFGEFYAFVAGHDPSITAADTDDVQDALYQVATLQKWLRHYSDALRGRAR